MQLQLNLRVEAVTRRRQNNSKKGSEPEFEKIREERAERMPKEEKAERIGPFGIETVTRHGEPLRPRSKK
jgi:hypothetical protein